MTCSWLGGEVSVRLQQRNELITVREVITNVVVRCDICGEEDLIHPISTMEFSWNGQNREADICDLDLKEITPIFDVLMEKSRRPEQTAKKIKRSSPYSKDKRLDQYLNTSTSMYECPATVSRHGEEEFPCRRQFTTPGGLAIHHARKHGKSI